MGREHEKMKVVYLVRHARAGVKGSSETDFDRPLEFQGIEEAKAISKRFFKTQPAPEQLISSPAKRALQTAEIFAKRMNLPAENITLKDGLYGESNTQSLIQLIGDIEESQSSVMLFGHDPQFSEAAAELAVGFDQQLPKAAIVGIGFDAESWKDVAKGKGHVVFYDYPLTKAQRAKLDKAARKEIASKLETIISDALKTVDEIGTGKLKGDIRKTSQKIAEKFLEVAKGSNTIFRRWAPTIPLDADTDEKVKKTKREKSS